MVVVNGKGPVIDNGKNCRTEVRFRDRFLALSDPNIAYILMMVGMSASFELSTLGAILLGVIGGISLILAFFASRAC
jgi:membrane-bound ClpP family serine protease